MFKKNSIAIFANVRLAGKKKKTAGRDRAKGLIARIARAPHPMLKKKSKQHNIARGIASSGIEKLQGRPGANRCEIFIFS